MKRDTLAKWMLAAAALAFAYACQPKKSEPAPKPPEAPKQDESCSKCGGRVGEAEAPLQVIEMEEAAPVVVKAPEVETAAPVVADDGLTAGSSCPSKCNTCPDKEKNSCPSKSGTCPSSGSCPSKDNAPKKCGTCPNNEMSNAGSNMGSPTGGGDTSQVEAPQAQEAAAPVAQ